MRYALLRYALEPSTCRNFGWTLASVLAKRLNTIWNCYPTLMFFAPSVMNCSADSSLERAESAS